MAYIFSSESVSEGHPDKVCDIIADAILDFCLEKNPQARLACEVMATTNRLIICGEANPIPSAAEVEKLARKTIRDIGYEQEGFHWQEIKIENYLHEQSADIAAGVGEEGAGDQGVMFGYACDETPELMPAPIQYAHAILRRLAEGRKNGEFHVLEPDAKSQLCLDYNGDGKPVGCSSITVSTQHKPQSAVDDLKQIIMGVAGEVLPEGWINKDTSFHINPAGSFIIGGPDGDCGLTGRKIVVDTYGGAAPHGGGAFSGKDASKVDRSAAYMARWMAKNLVAAGVAKKCTIQLCYAIGMSRPLARYIDFHGTCDNPKAATKALDELVDLAPGGIRKQLQLERPIYLPTASYGHFGRSPTADGGFSWERTDKLAPAIKKLL